MSNIDFNRRDFMVAASTVGSAILTDRLMAKAPAGAAFHLADQVSAAGQSVARVQSPRVLVFDVNQTLLDTDALRPHFQRVFRDGSVLDEWFSLLLYYSIVVSVTDSYTDFGTVGKGALEMLATTRGVQLAPADENAILQGVLTLPAFPEVAASLERLRAAGFRMVTLTNSSSTGVKAQLQNAGLTRFFEESISVDSVRRFKPELEVYRSAAVHLQSQPGDLMMIAAHAWDVLGAMKAGWRAAFVGRPGKVLFPLGPRPEIAAKDIKTVADTLMR
jgi:2-haloacid dehalogenase